MRTCVHNTYGKFPFDKLDELLVRQMSLLAPAFDLLWKFILIPETWRQLDHSFPVLE